MILAFDAPVGTEEERRSDQVWPGHWVDATGYAAKYPPSMHRNDYHTGADLNLNWPTYDADAHAPCYAAADGLVVVAGLFPIWGAIVVIEHDDVPEAGRVFTRYAHLESMQVQPGMAIKRGMPIGRIGNASGRYAYHLHFDVARADLGQHPTDWPNTDLQRLLATYFDPRQFIIEHRGGQGGDVPLTMQRVVTADPRLHVRQAPDLTAPIAGYVLKDAVVTLLDERDGWGLIANPVSGWIFLEWTRPAE